MCDKLEAQCYVLILLYEITQGYDTGEYRQRVVDILIKAGCNNLIDSLVLWEGRGISSVELISRIEQSIKNEVKNSPSTPNT